VLDRNADDLMLNDPGANASGFEPDSKRLGMICAPGTT